MKFTLSWLKDHLETEASLTEILDILNAIGLEVEEVVDPSETLGAFKIGYVKAAEKHPDADKLQVCIVDTGSEEITVVCGAPNARADMKVVLGRPGDYVPGLDVTLALRPVRGVESNGMMCSSAELNLGEDSDGIMDLPADAPVGESYIDYAGLNDPVIEIAITPNRQDCLGVYGIARDLAAAGLGRLKPYQIPEIKGSFESPVSVSVQGEGCPAYIGYSFRGVKNDQSPLWLQNRLTSVGVKVISKLVDVTNYISYEFGRPLHVYDAAKVTGNIVTRVATEGESFTALDDNEYTCIGGESVIADEAGILGFAGIIGGSASGVSEETTDVILEIGYFDPIRAATTGRHHGILTDARYRSERGLDAGFMEAGAKIAVQMILDLCGGDVSQPFSDGTAPILDKTVSFRSDRVMTLGGVDLPAEKSIEILSSLGFTVQESNPYMVTIPSWRTDVDGEADLVEEVLRIYGYDNIPSVQLDVTNHKAGTTLSDNQKRARATKRGLASSGMHEAVTWSFMSQADAVAFGGGDSKLTVDNPISSDLDQMRPSILPNLLKAAQRNKDRGNGNMALFEVGPVYLDDTNKGQLLVASGIRTGQTNERHWAVASDDVSVFEAKADALRALEAAGAPVQNLQVFTEAPEYYHPGRKGTLRLGPKNILASFGELHPSALKALDVDGPAVGFEVYLDRIPAARNKTANKGALDVSNLQSVERDFAFLVDQNKAAGDLLRAVKGADKKYISSVSLFDVYEGKGVPEGQKSLALCVTLTPDTTTFADSDIEQISAKIIQAAHKSVGAELRG
ncbi:phenylalanine--tRNA ligase subunit beta [Temperatibacter marinus]|uniref:Phenylalanine--tRNA ligase beta subunit n=1 Tax=Temperatibacter marinus TaxID=1456591 RepID=A0AA52EDZ5_9PROT|nr:phenylalanine--tRNA ligase subunit beta [Temperatibacter marinus]WND03722.1 phenylalanine--tRNA ligase subunit beta [Temperatibacter marinus]